MCFVLFLLRKYKSTFAVFVFICLCMLWSTPRMHPNPPYFHIQTWASEAAVIEKLLLFVLAKHCVSHQKNTSITKYIYIYVYNILLHLSLYIFLTWVIIATNSAQLRTLSECSNTFEKISLFVTFNFSFFFFCIFSLEYSWKYIYNIGFE